MGTAGQFKISAIEQVLDKCLGGFEKKITDHYIRYKANGRVYPSFPLGKHGKGDKEIEKGHVKKLFRELGVSLECAESILGKGTMG